MAFLQALGETDFGAPRFEVHGGGLGLEGGGLEGVGGRKGWGVGG